MKKKALAAVAVLAATALAWATARAFDMEALNECLQYQSSRGAAPGWCDEVPGFR